MDDELAMIRQRRVAELQNQATTPTATGEPIPVDGADLPQFVKDNKLVMVDVWAIWCGPCRMMEPVVEELARQWAGRAAIAKIDADENQDVVMKYGIQGIPTFLFFKDGQLAGRLVGARPKRDFTSVLTELAGRSSEPDQAFQ